MPSGAALAPAPAPARIWWQAVAAGLAASQEAAASSSLPPPCSLCPLFRYGVWADWSNPYVTLDPAYEAAQIGVFGAMVGAPPPPHT